MTSDTLWYGAAAFVIVSVIGYLLVRRTRVHGIGASDPIRALPPGWQFYSNPTTLEPPGTVFRIDVEGRRYIVDTLDVKIQSGAEAAGRTQESVEASTRIVARFLRLGNHQAGVSARKTERFTFEISDPVAEVVADTDFDKVIAPFMENLRIRAGNRYFVIRNARLASAIECRLSRSQVDDFGGEASIAAKLAAEGKMLASDRNGEYVLAQTFKQPMRVMFLPEELRVATAGLAAEKPRLATFQVTGPLHWEDTPDASPSASSFA